MDFRTATLEDATQLAQVHRHARIKAMPWLPVLHSLEGDIGFFRNRVLPSHRVECAVIQGEVVGFSAAKDGWLDHLYIAPAQWRCGIGGRLLSNLMNETRFLQLWAFQGNDQARAFYASFGFQEVEFTDGKNNEEKTPDVRMEWSKP